MCTELIPFWCFALINDTGRLRYDTDNNNSSKFVSSNNYYYELLMCSAVFAEYIAYKVGYITRNYRCELWQK